MIEVYVKKKVPETAKECGNMDCMECVHNCLNSHADCEMGIQLRLKPGRM